MKNTNVAYDFSAFETRPQEQPRVQPQRAPIKKVAVNPNTRVVAVGMSPLRIVAILLLIICVSAAMLISRVQLAETINTVNEANEQYKELQAEGVRLNLQLEGTVSLKNAEDYATNQLGMSKLESGQIEYVTLTQGNKIEADTQQGKDWLAAIGEFFTNLLS